MSIMADYVEELLSEFKNLSLSEPRVIETPAGHYIGHETWEPTLGIWTPWNCMTAYMSEDEAYAMLSEYVMPQCISDMERKAVREYNLGLTEFIITAISRGYFDE